MGHFRKYFIVYKPGQLKGITSAWVVVTPVTQGGPYGDWNRTSSPRLLSQILPLHPPLPVTVHHHSAFVMLNERREGERCIKMDATSYLIKTLIVTDV